jgi:hypothetical protein
MTAMRWPLGVLLTSWRYLWETTAVHRWELDGNWAEDAPPALPAGINAEGLQEADDGVGPLVHRIYRTLIVGSSVSATELIARIGADIDCIAPGEFATFQRVAGEPGSLTAGDEFVVRMPGPWDGPVRVVATSPTSFRFATLTGHLEAGQIEFRATSDYRVLRFEIESWARSGDRLSDFLYTRLRISKEVQMHMWMSTLRRVVALAGGRMTGGIVVTTRSVRPGSPPTAFISSGSRESRELHSLSQREINFDSTRLDEYIASGQWRVDDLVEPLPHEPSGPPVPNGTWEVAREAMVGYQLADPRVVTAIYDPDAPLPGRNMALRIRYGPLRLYVGVRVGEVYEEAIELGGRNVQIFGWLYRTLEGHFEAGQMHYEVWKWLETGEVEFHLRAVSRPAASGPLLPRLGFRLIGRIHQLRFYRQACRRIRRLTEAKLETNLVAVQSTPQQ